MRLDIQVTTDLFLTRTLFSLTFILVYTAMTNDLEDSNSYPFLPNLYNIINLGQVFL